MASIKLFKHHIFSWMWIRIRPSRKVWIRIRKLIQFLISIYTFYRTRMNSFHCMPQEECNILKNITLNFFSLCMTLYFFVSLVLYHNTGQYTLQYFRSLLNLDVNPKMYVSGCCKPPLAVVFYALNSSLGNPYPKILDLSNLFVADAQMKKI